jgi:CxxC motif-containing protein (DUF1111 family)
MKKARLALLPAICLTLVIAAHESLTEAPAGFTTPTLGQLIDANGQLTGNPGTQSVSNGIAEPAGDTFALDQAQFERRHDPSSGLGPVFNATSCSECHQNGVSGAASQVTEVRAGHRDSNGMFVGAMVAIDGGANVIANRALVNDRSICPQAQEHVPNAENIRAFRAVLNTLGDGFVEAVNDQVFLRIAAHQAIETHGRIHGEGIQVPIFEAPGHTALGKFGWKDQNPTILSFSADAYLNEMGVTSRLRPMDVTSVCKVTTDPEDKPDSLGMADIDHFAQFIRGTQAPPRDVALAGTSDAIAGEFIFRQIHCNLCHVETLVTEQAGAVINGGAYVVPDALGGKIFHPYGDFLLHDLETGDGIVQAGPQDTANKMRTVPLWGLHIKSRFMHDNASLTLTEAIERHKGESREVTEEFNRLDTDEKHQLLVFLKSL